MRHRIKTDQFSRSVTSEPTVPPPPPPLTSLRNSWRHPYQCFIKVSVPCKCSRSKDCLTFVIINFRTDRLVRGMGAQTPDPEKLLLWEILRHKCSVWFQINETPSIKTFHLRAKTNFIFFSLNFIDFMILGKSDTSKSWLVS